MSRFFGVPCHGVKCKVALPLTWERLDTYLGDRDEREIGSNTIAYRDRGEIVVRYYETDVLRYHADHRTVTFHAGGYTTLSTGQRFAWAGAGWHTPDDTGFRIDRSAGTARRLTGATFDYRAGRIVGRKHTAWARPRTDTRTG